MHINTVLVYLEMHCVFFYKIYGKYYFFLTVYEKVLVRVKFNSIHLTYNTKQVFRTSIASDLEPNLNIVLL